MRRSIVAIGAVALLGLAACGTTEEPSTQAAGTGDAAASGPVTVTDSRGEEITLDQPAQRVVVLEWGEAEMVQSLGVTPVGVADVAGFGTWDASVELPGSVEDVGTRGEPSIDAIVALDPDLVIAIPDTGADVTEQLEEYVPVLVTRSTDASRNLDRLREDFTMVATALGRQDAADDVLAEMDATIAAAKAQVDEAGMAGTPFVMADGWKEGSAVSIRPFGEGSLVSDVAEAIGLSNAWTGEVDAAWGLGLTDLEGMTTVTDPDTHLVYSASEEDVFADDLSANPIWTSLPFGSADRMHKLEPGTWTFGGPRSVESLATQMAAGISG